MRCIDSLGHQQENQVDHFDILLRNFRVGNVKFISQGNGTQE